jgi:hypothetical protein
VPRLARSGTGASGDNSSEQREERHDNPSDEARAQADPSRSQQMTRFVTR